MIVTSTIDASRNWTSALSRFGFGVMVLASLSKIGLFPSSLDAPTVGSDQLALVYLPVLVFWIMLAMVVGAVATMLGSIGPNSSYGELAKAKRAYFIGKTGNPLLADLLRDANGKYELASGFLGVIYLLCLGAAVGWISGLIEPTPNSTGGNLPSNYGWIVASFGGAGGLTAYLVRRSATGSIDAIDSVLGQYFPEMKEIP